MSKRLAPKSSIYARTSASPYEAFDQIDGRHPWQDAVPTGFVLYPVRKLERGKVVQFNFALAREMGLIATSHPDELTPELEKKILETFALQIVNEYDQQNGVQARKNVLKEHGYMATRYLQLQHTDKAGRTSGDGRSIWNGTIENKGRTWDISSRGTGVTCLAPGAVQANRPLKTGEGEFGYGCGLADVSELLGSALLSEIFHLNGLGTERVLTVIDLGKGCGIGVRAAPNLIRPAHLFLYLKQERVEPLRQATDYFIHRQTENGEWNFSPHAPDRYRRMLREISQSFARFAARLEREYIFAWMDWDGDNVLANGGIIDYGSIRQFGLRHDQYRYDDVDRFSTNLNEQRGKARLMVQVFAQLVTMLETGKRRPIDEFENHAAVREFDREFDRALRQHFLAQVGLSPNEIDSLMKTKRALVEELYSSFLILEKIKTKAKTKRLPDGVNRPAVFKMRAALRELPSYMSFKGGLTLGATADELLEIMTSSHAKRADRRLKGQLRKRIEHFLKSYQALLAAIYDDAANLKEMRGRAEDRNRAGRVTGNGAEFIIDEIIKALKNGVAVADVQAAAHLFVATQIPRTLMGNRRHKPASLQSDAGRLFQALVNLAEEFEEDI